MGRLDACWSSKVYALRRQYPIIREFEKRIKVVEKELNKEHTNKKNMCDHCGKSMCDCSGKPMCKNVCKSRQKR